MNAVKVFSTRRSRYLMCFGLLILLVLLQVNTSNKLYAQATTPTSTPGQTLTTTPTRTPTPTRTTTPTPTATPTCTTPGNAVDRAAFAGDVLAGVGIPACTFSTGAMQAWPAYENTLACFNPLATTQRMPGSWDFNSVHVQNYLNYNMGVQATSRTLSNGRYNSILEMLREDGFNRAQIGANLGTWGTGAGPLTPWERLWRNNVGPRLNAAPAAVTINRCQRRDQQVTVAVQNLSQCRAHDFQLRLETTGGAQASLASPTVNVAAGATGNVILTVAGASEAGTVRIIGNANNAQDVSVDVTVGVQVVDGPGCDHSDDNYSSASAQAPAPALLEEEPPHVAVLANGFAGDAAGFVNALKEPNTLVNPDFSPDLVQDYPVLVIPTGGLYGLENSDFFRARLEEYAKRGGTIIVFDQQHGSHYSVLPSGGLGGYGWAEDNSCNLSSLYIRNYDQVLSGFDKAILNSNVDGYFTAVPTNTNVLLWRTKNGQPAMVRYPYGAGTVIATTAYDDWGTTNWQTTEDAYVLNRDLLAWAVDPALLPEFDPGAPITLPLAITNNSGTEAVAVQLSLLAPGKQIVHQDTYSISLAAGASMSLTYNTTAARPLGIWRVDYALSDASGQTIQARQPGERFVVKNPSPLSAPVKDVAFSLNSTTERFIAGSNGVFTFTVYNNSPVTRTLQVRYGLPHHTWETGDSATYGNFSDLSNTVVVGPNSQEQFVHVFPMRTNDRLFAYLYEGGTLKDQTWYQTRKSPAMANTVVRVSQPEFGRGQTVEIAANVTNLADLAVTLGLKLQVIAPGAVVVYSDTRSLALSSSQAQTETFSFVLPATVQNGSFRVQADVFHESTRISGDVSSFTLPNSPAQFDLTLPANLPFATSDPLHIAISNTHAYLPVTGTLDLMVTDPQGITTTLAEQPYALPAGQTDAISFDLTGLPAKLGTYRFDLSAFDQYSQRRWYTTKRAVLFTGLAFDRQTYRVRDTLLLTATVNNDGEWHLIPQVMLAVPDLGFSHVQNIPLSAGEGSVLTYSLAIPEDLPAGLHEAILIVDMGDVISTSQHFSVPPARILASMNQTDYQAGDTVTVTLANAGGVDATTAYTLTLVDSAGLSVVEQHNVIPVQAGQTAIAELAILTATVSGPYQLILDGINQQTGVRFSLLQGISITGVEGTLMVHPDRSAYFSDEPVTAQGHIQVSRGQLGEGTLNLRIYSDRVVGGSCTIPSATSASTGPGPMSVSLTPSLLAAFHHLVNLYIDTAIEGTGTNAGRFTLATVEGDPNNPNDNNERLLYGWPSPWSSFTTVRIGTSDYTFGSSAGTFVDGPRLTDDGESIAAWQVGDVIITQSLSLVNSPSGNPDALRIKYTARNLGSTTLDVGTRIMLDTQLGFNDGAPFRLPNGAEVTTEREFTSTAIPLLWLTVDDLSNPQIAAQGQLQPGVPALPIPDRWVFADWGSIYNTIWNFTVDPSRSVTNDSAVAGWWNPIALAPGDTQTVGFDYGVASIAGTSGDLSTAVNAPNTIADPSGNPFTVRAFIRNNTFSAAHNVQSLISLPPGLILEPGYAATRELGDLVAGQVVQVIWQVRATGAVVGTLNYSVATTSDDVAGSTTNLSICVPDFLSNRDVNGFLVWETTLSVTNPISLDLSTLAGLMPSTGHYYLVGTLRSETGQVVTTDDDDFFVLDRNTGLTMLTDKRVYRAGDTIQVSGLVTNSTVLTATMSLQVTTDSITLLEQPLTLAPGEGYAYTSSLTSTTDVTLTATANGVSVYRTVVVAEPELWASLDAPSVVGHEPFLTGVTVTNTGRVPASVNVTIADAMTDSVTLPPGTSARVQGSMSITQDATIVAVITGDLNQTLTATVLFGEAAHVTFQPQPVYPVGPVVVPYTITNTGLLPVSFETEIALRDNLGEVVVTSTIPTSLPSDESQPGILRFEYLPAGAYTLNYRTPFEMGSEPFTVIASDPARLTAVAGLADATMIPVTATVTNPGFQSFSGHVTLHTDFVFLSAPVTDLASGSSVTLVLPVDVGAAASGDHPAQLDLLDLAGAVVDQAMVTLTVPAANLVLTTLPTNLTLPVSTTVTFDFGVTNRGGTQGEGSLSLAFSDVVDEEKHFWLPGGGQDTIAFTFFVPPDLEAKTYQANYVFNGKPGVLLLTVEGIDIGVTSSLDKASYYEGETALLTLHVTERADRPTLPLYARVRFNDSDQIQPFTLTPLGSTDLAFTVPVSFLQDEKVFYGIYELSSDRSIHLNTVYLPRLYSDVSILTDKQVYRPGETVVATVVTTATGQLEVSAPGFTGTVVLSGANTGFSFVLPTTMARGTYSIDSIPRDCNCANEDQVLRTLFDVDAPEVRVTDASLSEPVCEPGQTNQLDLTVASDRPVTARFLTWLERPDGSVISGPERIVNLDALPANLLTTLFVPVTDQNGMHQVHYRLVSPSDPNVLYASGAETCDVGQAVIVSVVTDKPTYADGESVLATVTLYATQAVSGELVLSVDSPLSNNRSVSLESGFSQQQVSLGHGFVPGRHEVQALLTQAARTSTGKTHFDYGADLPDLIVESPIALSNGTLTRTVPLWMSNVGASAAPTTTVALYDGDPTVGGQLLGSASVPVLAPGSSYAANIFWSVAGRTSLTLTLYARVDPNDVVRESREDNNQSSAQVKLPARVEAGPDQTVNEGDTVELLAATFTGPEPLDTYTATVQWQSYITATIPTITLNGPTGVLSGTYIYPDEGVFAAFVTVCDMDDICAFDTFDITVLNVPPAVIANPGQTINKGEVLSMTLATFTDPGVLDTHTATIDWGDGGVEEGVVSESGGSGAVSGSHVYVSGGTYTVTVTVVDNGGDAGGGVLPISVIGNAPPTVDAGPDQTVDEGSGVIFHGSFADPDVGDVHTINWAFGDGTSSTDTLTPTHVYTQSGVFTATLTVTDSAGGTGSDTLRVTVRGATPTLACLQATESLDLRDRTVVSVTTVFGGRYFELGADGRVYGDIVVDGNAFLRSRARVEGDLTLAGTLQRQDNVVIVGTLTEGAAVSAPSIPTRTVTFGSTDLTVENGQNAIWLPGNYRDGLVRARGSVVLSAGTYNFRALNIEPDVDVILDTSAGAININIAGALEFGDRSEISASDGSRVAFYTNAGGTVRIGTDVVFNGQIVAPYARVQAFSRTVIDGCLAGKTIVIEPDTRLQPPSSSTPTALYPIALHRSSLQSVLVGQSLPDVYNGTGQGNFGWLSWTGANGEPVLVQSLTPPGNSQTYINPNDSADHLLSINDWVYGRPGVANSKGVRDALDLLKTLIITVPVWDMATGQGNNTQYHVAGCARIQITSYRLPGQNRISATYWGITGCH